MSTDRFVHQDIDFFHKRTCSVLLEKLGPYGPLAFLSLCTEAKRSRIPGTVIVSSEPDFWKQLGLYGRDLGFDMETLLRLLGRQKQTSRRRVGLLLHVVLTNYGRWQNDVRRESERERKSRYRHESGRDNVPPSTGTRRGQKADREGEGDIPPYPQGGNGTVSGQNGGRPSCPHCPGGMSFKTLERLADHLANVHGVEPAKDAA